MKRHLLTTLGASLILTSAGFAQGDTCTDAPTPLVGSSPFAFDTTGLTSSGNQLPAHWENTLACGAGSANAFSADGFWIYTAPSTGNFDFEITSHAGGDSQMALYRITSTTDICNQASCLGVDDNSGNESLSKISGVALTSGELILVQIGGAGTENAGPGTLNVSQLGGIDCSSTSEDALAPNQTCGQAASIGNGTYPGLWTDQTQDDYFVVCVAGGDTLLVDLTSTSYLGGDFDLTLWGADSGCADSSLAFSEESGPVETLSFTNSGLSPRTLVIKVELWNDSSNPLCDNYDLTIAGTGGAGCAQVSGTFCDPANMNSTGAACVLSGGFTGLNYTLHLEATNGPPGEFGFFLVGDADSPMVLQSGNLCLNPFHRYSIVGGPMNSTGMFDGAGILQNLVGTSTTGSGFDVPNGLPRTGTPVIMAGDTWSFQVYYRDGFGTPGGNLSNGLTVMF